MNTSLLFGLSGRPPSYWESALMVHLLTYRRIWVEGSDGKARSLNLLDVVYGSLLGASST